jgi:hypothetical protein
MGEHWEQVLVRSVLLPVLEATVTELACLLNETGWSVEYSVIKAIKLSVQAGLEANGGDVGDRNFVDDIGTSNDAFDGWRSGM